MTLLSVRGGEKKLKMNSEERTVRYNMRNFNSTFDYFRIQKLRQLKIVVEIA